MDKINILVADDDVEIVYIIRKIQKNKKSLKKVLTTVKSCDRIHLVAEVIRKRQTNK